MAARYETVFFDFDGVLVDSHDIKVRAFRRLYEPFGADVEAAAVAHHLEHGGVSRRKKIRYCHKQFLDIRLTEAEIDDLARRFSALVVDEVVACPYVPGARAVLDAWRDRLPLFVVSGTPQAELEDIIGRRGMSGDFAGLRGSPPSKVPHIRELIAIHGFTPERVLFVGDAMTDYHAATTCGLEFVGRVHNGYAAPFPPGTETISDLTALMI